MITGDTEGGNNMIDYLQSGETIYEVVSTSSHNEDYEMLDLSKIDVQQKNAFQKRGTLCWRCRNTTCNECEWFSKGEEVPGWIAEPSRASNRGSYQIYDCPKFVPTKERKPKNRYFKEIIEVLSLEDIPL